MRRIAQPAGVFVVGLILSGAAGCPQYADPSVPAPIRQQVEPQTHSKYLLYVPSGYRRETPVSLIIACHGTKPWDRPDRQIRDWVKLAETRNFIVAAPHLIGTRGDLPPSPSRQLQLQRDDERTILSVIRHIQAGHSIARDGIFLTGWSAGGYAVLHTGMKHPELFRALAVLQGNFDPAFLSDVEGRIDPYQPVYVLFGTTDVLTGKQGESCVDWLYKHGANAVENKVPGPHRAHPREAYDFFEKVVREVPWLRVRAHAVGPNQPFTIRFSALKSFEPARYGWSFGDGETSPIAAPIHTYEQPGEFTVTLETASPSGKPVQRSITISVPTSGVQHGLDE